MRICADKAKMKSRQANRLVGSVILSFKLFDHTFEDLSRYNINIFRAIFDENIHLRREMERVRISLCRHDETIGR
jgi:hypothetical protein